VDTNLNTKEDTRIALRLKVDSRTTSPATVDLRVGTKITEVGIAEAEVASVVATGTRTSRATLVQDQFLKTNQ
jgi:hypothetical protein